MTREQLTVFIAAQDELEKFSFRVHGQTAILIWPAAAILRDNGRLGRSARRCLVGLSRMLPKHSSSNASQRQQEAKRTFHLTPPGWSLETKLMTSSAFQLFEEANTGSWRNNTVIAHFSAQRMFQNHRCAVVRSSTAVRRSDASLASREERRHLRPFGRCEI